MSSPVFSRSGLTFAAGPANASQSPTASSTNSMEYDRQAIAPSSSQEAGFFSARFKPTGPPSDTSSTSPFDGSFARSSAYPQPSQGYFGDLAPTVPQYLSNPSPVSSGPPSPPTLSASSTSPRANPVRIGTETRRQPQTASAQAINDIARAARSSSRSPSDSMRSQGHVRRGSTMARSDREARRNELHASVSGVSAARIPVLPPPRVEVQPDTPGVAESMARMQPSIRARLEAAQRVIDAPRDPATPRTPAEQDEYDRAFRTIRHIMWMQTPRPVRQRNFGFLGLYSSDSTSTRLDGSDEWSSPWRTVGLPEGYIDPTGTFGDAGDQPMREPSNRSVGWSPYGRPDGQRRVPTLLRQSPPPRNSPPASRPLSALRLRQESSSSTANEDRLRSLTPPAGTLRAELARLEGQTERQRATRTRRHIFSPPADDVQHVESSHPGEIAPDRISASGRRPLRMFGDLGEPQSNLYTLPNDSPFFRPLPRPTSDGERHEDPLGFLYRRAQLPSASSTQRFDFGETDSESSTGSTRDNVLFGEPTLRRDADVFQRQTERLVEQMMRGPRPSVYATATDYLIRSDRQRARGAIAEGLRKVECKAHSKIEGEVDECCAVCHDEYTPDVNVAITPCKHMFHMSCLETWFETSVTCPMCRKAFRGGDDCEDQRMAAHAIRRQLMEEYGMY